MAPAKAICRVLDWDSEFFGQKIAQVTVNTLESGEMKRVIAWCGAHHIRCLYFLAEADRAQTVRLAEDNGFRLVDTRITLGKKLHQAQTVPNGTTPNVVRRCRPGDVTSLRTIARASHRDSRFYYDSNFPRSLCDHLYEVWIEKSCRGYADVVFVVESRNRPAGYISCHLLGKRKGKIGLVGVAPHSRGRGLGKALISQALRWFSQQGVRDVTVVTQGRNHRAQRLYQQLGFHSRSVQLWYHLWFKPAEEAGSG
jgi:dTDP-4-amino-4,6-dideoxy-D-galactose acyltransferase